MAQLFQATGGVVGSLLPSTTWAAPNGMFPTTDRNDDTAYSWASATSTVTLPASNLADGYLILAGFELEDTSNGRCNPQARFVQASGTGNFVSAATGGYNRDSSEDRSYASTWAFIDNPSASATIQFQWRRDSDAPTGGTARAYFQVIPFYYSDIGLYSSTSTTATGGTTPSQITGFSGTDGTNITISLSQVTVTGDNKRYLVLGGAYHQGVGSSRTQRWYGLRVDGSFDHAAKGCMYYRNSGNADGGESFMRLLETNTASRTVALMQYRGDGVAAGQGGADVDGNTTGSNSQHALVVIELNDSAEVFSSVDSVGGQELALTGPVDIDIASTGDIEFNDGDQYARSSDTAVDVGEPADTLAFANISHARGASSIGSGSRWTVHGEFTKNGAEITDVGFHGNYNRGNQSSQDTHGSSCNMAAFLALVKGDTIGVSQQELTGTEGGGGDIETQAGWVGFGLIDLDSLQAAGPSTIEPTGVSNTNSEGSPTLVASPATISPTGVSNTNSVGDATIRRSSAELPFDWVPASDIIVSQYDGTGDITYDFWAGRSPVSGESQLELENDPAGGTGSDEVITALSADGHPTISSTNTGDTLQIKARWHTGGTWSVQSTILRHLATGVTNTSSVGTATLTGGVTHTGTVDADAQAAAVAIVGDRGVQGDVDADAQAASADADGWRGVQGTSDADAQSAATAAPGKRGSQGDVAADAQAASADVDGWSAHQGSVDAQAQAASASAAGTAGAHVSGTVDADAQAASASASGWRGSQGDVDAVPSGAAVGNQHIFGPPFVYLYRQGTADADAQSATTTIPGQRGSQGDVDAASQAAQASATGESEATKSGDVDAQAQAASAAATGHITRVGDVLAEAEDAEAAAAGLTARQGAVDAVAQAVSAAIAGYRTSVGTVDAASQSAAAASYAGPFAEHFFNWVPEPGVIVSQYEGGQIDQYSLYDSATVGDQLRVTTAVTGGSGDEVVTDLTENGYLTIINTELGDVLEVEFWCWDAVGGWQGPYTYTITVTDGGVTGTVAALAGASQAISGGAAVRTGVGGVTAQAASGSAAGQRGSQAAVSCEAQEASASATGEIQIQHTATVAAQAQQAQASATSGRIRQGTVTAVSAPATLSRSYGNVGDIGKVYLNTTPSKDGNEEEQPVLLWTNTMIRVGALDLGSLAPGPMFIGIERFDTTLSNWYPITVSSVKASDVDCQAQAAAVAIAGAVTLQGTAGLVAGHAACAISGARVAAGQIIADSLPANTSTSGEGIIAGSVVASAQAAQAAAAGDVDTDRIGTVAAQAQPATTDVFAVVGNFGRVWINDTPALTGSERSQPVADWENTEIRLAFIDIQGLPGGTLYMAVERADGELSNWYQIEVVHALNEDPVILTTEPAQVVMAGSVTRIGAVAAQAQNAQTQFTMPPREITGTVTADAERATVMAVAVLDGVVTGSCYPEAQNASVAIVAARQRWIWATSGIEVESQPATFFVPGSVGGFHLGSSDCQAQPANVLAVGRFQHIATVNAISQPAQARIAADVANRIGGQVAARAGAAVVDLSSYRRVVGLSESRSARATVAGSSFRQTYGSVAAVSQGATALAVTDRVIEGQVAAVAGASIITFDTQREFGGAHFGVSVETADRGVYALPKYSVDVLNPPEAEDE